MGDFYGCIKAFHSLRHGRLYVNLIELFHEQVAVLCYHDGLDRCAEHLDVVFVKHAAQVKLRTAVECGLSTESEQYAVGTLFLDDFFDEVRGDWEEIHFIGHAFRGLDSGDVGID